MRRFARFIGWVVLGAAAMALGACGSSGDGGGGADTPGDAAVDTIDDGAPADSGGETEATPDVGADVPADVPADVAADAPADAPADVPADVPADTPADPGGDAEPLHDFAVPAPGVAFTYMLQRCGGDAFEVPGNYDTTIELAGQTFRRVQVGDFVAATREGFETFSRFKDGRIEFAGASVYGPGSADPGLTYTLDPPVGGPLWVEEGYTDTTTSSGQLCFTDNCQPFDVEFTFTVVSKNASVTVPYGTVDGCLHIAFEQRSSDMPDFVLPVEWWVKEGIGLVKATEVPGFCGLELKAYTLPD